MVPDDEDDIASRILASIAALPVEEQAEVIHALIGGALKEMPAQVIHQIRAEIVAQFPEEMPVVQSTLQLIDGHLALREIAGPAHWR